MPNPSQIAGDNDAFLNLENEIAETIAKSREKLQGTSLTTRCILCGEEIGTERKTAVPNAVNCISCAEELEKPPGYQPYLTRRQRKYRK